VIKLVWDRSLKSQRVLYFFASPKKVTKKSSLMIFFCKISPFFLPHHPDRLSLRFTCSKALWVAPSASAKNIANAPAGPIAKNVH
jgi:hypothetical protein